MKRIVWRYGLIAGAVLSAMMLLTIPFMENIGMETSYVIGYTTMVVAFLMVYFGIRAYRDEALGGTIRFGRAFQAGILITLIACVCYVATWEVIYHTMVPDFAEKYSARVLAKAKASGAPQQQLDAQAKEMARFAEMYRNPVINVAYTFIEPFPVGLVFTLVCAGVLSRRRREQAAGGALQPGA